MMRTILVVLLLFPLFLSAQNLNDGLVAYYPFNGNANDESGNGNHGIDVGTVRYIDGIISEERQFINDGINKEYLNIPNVISLDEYAISFWVKLTDVSVHNSIISFNSASDWTKSDLWIYSSTKRIAVIQNGQDLRTDNYGHIGYYPLGENFLSSDTLVNDTYYNVTLNYKNNTLSIYLNSEFYVQYKNVDPIPNNFGTGYIGITPHYNNSLLYQLDGDIDELRFYDRILTNDEIYELYNIGTCQYIIYDTITTYIAQDMPQDSMIAFYPFDGNANDESENSNNGVVNGATLTTDRFGNENSAYEFDGIDDYILIGDILDLDTSDFSISVWVKANEYLGGYGQKVLNKGLTKYGEPVNTGYGIRLVNDGTINNALFTLGGVESWQYYPLNSDLSLEQWLNLSFVRDSNQILCYLNGKLIEMYNNECIYNLDNNVPIAIGAIDKGNGLVDEFFKGKIDDIRIYKKALSPVEIKMLYYEGRSLEEIVSDNLVHDTIMYQDTIYHQVYDTNFVNDTVIFYDTITNYIYDSISVTDTLIIDVLLSDIPLAELGSVKIYPNPTNDKVIILLDDKILNQGYSIRIVNDIGTLIFESTSLQQNNYEIDISQFGAEGLYFVQILNLNGIVIDTRKIILK